MDRWVAMWVVGDVESTKDPVQPSLPIRLGPSCLGCGWSLTAVHEPPKSVSVARIRSTPIQASVSLLEDNSLAAQRLQPFFAAQKFNLKQNPDMCGRICYNIKTANGRAKHSKITEC